MKKVGLFVVLLIAATMVMMKFTNFLKTDTCLAFGGKWDYKTKECQN